MMPGKKEKGKAFEELMGDLEGQVRSLETGDLTLDQSIAAFETGMSLAKECDKKLSEAKAKVEKIIADETGTKTVPFEIKE
jgi:exodeoxyribonuclease VII small subunit